VSRVSPRGSTAFPRRPRGLLRLLALRLVAVDLVGDLGEVAFESVEAVVEVLLLLLRDLVVELVESPAAVLQHVLDAEPRVTGALAVLL